MMLRNITVKVCKEAEITGVITSKFVNETYSTNPLSKISGTFQIEEINPGLDVPAHRLGDKLNIKISKTLSFAGYSIKITAKGKAVNQGRYGAGYRTD